ncbi:MAG: methionine synthase [Ignavibacteriae bacterium]|nr:methionine synthase [Ignavibacteriota bacterium]
MKKISEQLKNKKVLLSDGAWGTFLQKEGLKQGECPELWNVENRDTVLKIAKSYIDAGSDMIGTNTFGGNKIKLNHYGLDSRTYELNKAAAEISREAASDEKIVIGSIGPNGKMLIMEDVTKEELYDSFAEQIKGLTAGGVDALCIETFFDIEEAEIALKAARENSDLEVILTFSFDKSPDGNYNTMMGVSPKTLVEQFSEKVDFIGTNCSNGFEDMIGIVKEMREINQTIPILVHANAGLPFVLDGKVKYPDTPQIMAELTPKLIDAGANLIGGCCGTTPEHIRMINDAIKKNTMEIKF